MAKRFTDTDKWDDKWFRNLSILEKICFNFICDRCDLAGFYAIDLEDMEFKIKASKDDVKGALMGLARGFVVKDGLLEDNTIIWIRRFIHHQKNLPLNPANPAHRGIINLINQHPEFIDDICKNTGALKGLFSPIGIGIGIGKDKEDDEEKKKLDVKAKWVIDQLNRIAEKKFKHSESNLKYVRQRLRDFPELKGEDFIRVIEYKTKQWKGGQMEKYLRPETLFGSKFDGYLNEAPPYEGSNKWMLGV